MQHVDTVRKIYRDFAAGDAAAILATSPTTWSFGLPKATRIAARAARGPARKPSRTSFFAVAGPEWEGWTIGVEKTIESAEAVVVEGRYTGLYKPTRPAAWTCRCATSGVSAAARSRAFTSTSTRPDSRM